MAGQGEPGVLGRHPGAVVARAEAFLAGLLDLQADARGLGVDGVLQQFLGDARRALDDLAGGDLVDEPVGQDANG